jgi:hypothetical protein
MILLNQFQKIRCLHLCNRKVQSKTYRLERISHQYMSCCFGVAIGEGIKINYKTKLYVQKSFCGIFSLNLHYSTRL